MPRKIIRSNEETEFQRIEYNTGFLSGIIMRP